MLKTANYEKNDFLRQFIYDFDFVKLKDKVEEIILQNVFISEFGLLKILWNIPSLKSKISRFLIHKMQIN